MASYSSNRRKKLLRWALALGGLTALLIVYALFDPQQAGWFPRCPFRVVTGLECPGCGSQRAVHRLLNLDVAGALRENVLLVLSIPYLAAGFILETRKAPGEGTLRWRKRLYGQKAIYVILAVIMLFWAARNIPFLSDYV